MFSDLDFLFVSLLATARLLDIPAANLPGMVRRQLEPQAPDMRRRYLRIPNGQTFRSWQRGGAS